MLFQLSVRLLIESSIFARSTIHDLRFASADQQTVASRKQQPKKTCCVAQQ